MLEGLIQSLTDKDSRAPEWVEGYADYLADYILADSFEYKKYSNLLDGWK